MAESRRPHLDGVRGLAIGLVLLAHVGKVDGAGLVGVLVFFVLSGYLITSLLVSEHAHLGRIDVRQFFLRRALRLLPALSLFLLLYLIAVSVLEAGTTTGEAARGVALALTYTTDFALGLQWGYVPELAHLWTLAVEEQFYLVWPVVLAAVLTRGGTRFQQSRLIVLLGLGGAVARCLTLTLTSVYPLYIYALPTSWIDALLMGALFALLVRTNTWARLRSRVARPLVAAAPLAVLLFFALHPGTYELSTTYTLGIPAMAFGAAVLISALEAGRLAVWTGIFSHPVAQWLGKMSYALYLYNSACILLARAVAGDSLASRLAGLTVAVVLSVVSFHLVERPALKLKERVGAPRQRAKESWVAQ